MPLMASPVGLYQDEMHDKLGFFATWLPADPMEVGDVGALEKGRFRRITSLKELGFEYGSKTAPSMQDLHYTSKNGTKLSAGAGASVGSEITGEIAIDFSGEGAFVFQASGLRAKRLENVPVVARQVLSAFKKGRWEKDWLLVEQIHLAKQATVIVSEDRSSRIVISAKGSGPITTACLADPRINFAVATIEGRMVHVVGATALTPLYSCVRIRTPIFGSPTFRSSQPLKDTKALSEPPIKELLAS
jgi:hypothetical protein